jgi:hypothetical protein
MRRDLFCTPRPIVGAPQAQEEMLPYFRESPWTNSFPVEIGRATHYTD